MKRTHRFVLITLLLCTSGGAILLSGCSTTMHHQTTPDAAYLSALKRTSPASSTLAAPGSEAESQGLARVLALFKNYSESNLRENISRVYARDVYFRDAFKHLTSAAEIEHYMLEGVKNLRSCSFEFEDVLSHNGEHYLRWTMVVNLKRDPPDKVERSMGMSHMRINAEGQVVFHQDYWDPTDVVYTKIPVANWLIRKVKEMQ
jgi:hypothetical protein